MPNPDPNHTHADFAVWVLGEKVDFSDAEYMSGTSTDEETHDEEDEYLNKYLHLHDEVGHVIHRHKPGLTVGEFLRSIDIEKAQSCLSLESQWNACEGSPTGVAWRMFVNGEERPFDLQYVFNDTDHILFIFTKDESEIRQALEEMTDDACLYSKTCPWRGEPPAENCISDPEVPCVLEE